MKSILVYGDSLVWGRNASQKDRYSFEDRWPNILASSLKDVSVWPNAQNTFFNITLRNQKMVAQIFYMLERTFQYI